jgi:hypothetical protein
MISRIGVIDVAYLESSNNMSTLSLQLDDLLLKIGNRIDPPTHLIKLTLRIIHIALGNTNAGFAVLNLALEPGNGSLTLCNIRLSVMNLFLKIRDCLLVPIDLLVELRDFLSTVVSCSNVGLLLLNLDLKFLPTRIKRVYVLAAHCRRELCLQSDRTA